MVMLRFNFFTRKKHVVDAGIKRIHHDMDMAVITATEKDFPIHEWYQEMKPGYRLARRRRNNRHLLS